MRKKSNKLVPISSETSSKGIRLIFNFLKRILLRFLLLLPDYNYNAIIFLFRLRYWPHFKKPRSFNEKIIHMKLFQRNILKKKVSDRIYARNYVLKKVECKLPQIIWIGKKITEEIWHKLPSKFVLKAYHGSGMTEIIEKRRSNIQILNKTIKEWLDIDYSKNKEWIYQNLPRKAIIEECLLDPNGNIPLDFKFFCFSGRVKIVQIDFDRFTQHRRNIYSRKFKRLDVELYYKNSTNIPKPANFNDAVRIAEEISNNFDFIRVDLYLLDDGIYFGELTCHPGGGLENFSSKKFDFLLGKYLNFN